MSKIEDNQISSQCGSTLTIGQSGDTIQLAAGATQSGFGRTGTVNWDTTAKTAGFTAVSGNGYFVNTTSGAITVTLPATPSAGDIVAVQDYAGTWATNNVTLGRNGSNIGGVAVDATLSTSEQSITLVYVDATRGWQTVNDSTQTVSQAQFVTATGGTITCCGNYKIHTFTGPGTFCVSCAGNSKGSNTVDYLVVAGGGGTDSGVSSGGGAGGFRLSNSTCMPAPLTSPLATSTGLPVSVQGYSITVGGGGTPGPHPGCGTSGSVSTFSTITSTGGGVGQKSNQVGTPGGSGSGGLGSPSWPGTGYSGGTGNTPPTSPPQGQPGGAGGDGLIAFTSGGGGGGAGQAGGPAEPGTGGSNYGGSGSYVLGTGFAGSNGTTGPVCGARYFSGGGGGGVNNFPAGPGAVSPGGSGGGGNGASQSSPTNTDGTANTGGGAGGATNLLSGKAGGSGIVIIRYKYQ